MTAGGIRWLDPGAVRLRVRRGRLVASLEGREAPDLVARPAFRWTGSPGPVMLMDPTGGCPGAIEDPSRLDPDSFRALGAVLEARAFLPEIVKIEDLVFESGSFRWTVQTDRGPRTFRTQQSWRTRSVVRMPSGPVLVRSLDGVRYRISEPGRLDPRSRSLLEPLG